MITLTPHWPPCMCLDAPGPFNEDGYGWSAGVPTEDPGVQLWVWSKKLVPLGVQWESYKILVSEEGFFGLFNYCTFKTTWPSLLSPICIRQSQTDLLFAAYFPYIFGLHTYPTYLSYILSLHTFPTYLPYTLSYILSLHTFPTYFTYILSLNTFLHTFLTYFP